MSELEAGTWGARLEDALFLVCRDRASAHRIAIRAMAAGGTPSQVRRTAYGLALKARVRAVSSAAPTVLPWDDEVARNDDDLEVTHALIREIEASSHMERAALAVTEVERLDPAEAASVLGVSQAEVQAHTATVRERLVQAHARARTGRGLTSADFAADRAIQAALAQVMRSPGALAPTEAEVDRLRTRRTRVKTVSAVAAVALVAAGALVAGPSVWDRLTPAASEPTPSRGNTASGSPSVSASGIEAWTTIDHWPARGSLRGDAEIQRSVQSLMGSSSRIIYAEHIPKAGRLVVVAVPGNDTGQPQRALLAPPTGRLTWREMPLVNQSMTSVTLVAGQADVTAPQVLVHLTTPDVTRAEVSSATTITRDGKAHRTWTPLRLANGVVTQAVSDALHLFYLRTPTDLLPLYPNNLSIDPGDAIAGLDGKDWMAGEQLFQDVSFMIDAKGARIEKDWEVPIPDAVADQMGLPYVLRRARAVSLSVVLPNGARLRMCQVTTQSGELAQSLGALTVIGADATPPPVIAQLFTTGNNVVIVDPMGVSAIVPGRMAKGVRFTKGVAQITGAAAIELGKGIVVTRRNGQQVGPLLPTEFNPLEEMTPMAP